MRPQFKEWFFISIIVLTATACGSSGGGGSTDNNKTTDELNSVVTASHSAPASACPNGGIQVDAGIDKNGNGVLDVSEVTSTQYVCNGTNGANGFNSLVSVVTEPVGSNCSTGGVKITAGVDTNTNGNLDTNEVSSTNYVCNGEGSPTPPDSVTGVSASAGNAQTIISWSPVSGATSYNIYWSATPGVTTAAGTKITGTTSPYTHTGRTNGTTYYYIVTAVNAGGESVASSQVSATPMPPVPTPPTGVSANAGTSQVSISWPVVSGATSYNIYWSTTPGVTTATGSKITGAISPYTHTGRSNGTTYYYIITAASMAGESTASSEVSAVPIVTLSSISVTPPNPTIAKGTTKQFVATGNFSDGTTQDLTSSITWGSSDTTIATISSNGLATSIAAGTTTITATSSPATGSKVGSTTLSIPISLPKTGQTLSYATGDDGNLQRGIAWPTPRFTNPDGTTPISGSVVVDKLTGLMWTKDGNIPGPAACGPATTKAWQAAIDYVACLNTNSYLGYTDWRLPNREELRSLVNYGQSNMATWLNSQGFANVQAFYYWSSSTVAAGTHLAWGVELLSGEVGNSNKFTSLNVWPVRSVPGPAVINLPRTGQTTSYSAGDDGNLQKGVAWPVPRFTNPDGTTPVTTNVVIDRLTGLMWTKDGNAPGPVACSPGEFKTWQGGLNYVACLNTNNYLGYNDWRLPNIHEIGSLINIGTLFSDGWLNSQGFSNVQGYCLSSTTITAGSGSEWLLYMSSDVIVSDDKASGRSAWPVRGGQ